jgi:hypothetical protein
VRDLGTRVVLVLGAQRGVLGRLGHPPDLDLECRPPAGEPDPGTPTSTRPPNTSALERAVLTRQVDHLEQAVGAAFLETAPAVAEHPDAQVVICTASTRNAARSLGTNRHSSGNLSGPPNDSPYEGTHKGEK